MALRSLFKNDRPVQGPSSPEGTGALVCPIRLARGSAVWAAASYIPGRPRSRAAGGRPSRGIRACLVGWAPCDITAPRLGGSSPARLPASRPRGSKIFNGREPGLEEETRSRHHAHNSMLPLTRRRQGKRARRNAESREQTAPHHFPGVPAGYSGWAPTSADWFKFAAT